MKLEVIKEYTKESYGVVDFYTIRRKILGLIPFYRTDFSEDFSDGQSVYMTLFVIYQAIFLVLGIVFYFLFSLEIITLFLTIAEFIILYGLNLTFRKKFSSLSSAQYEIKQIIKFTSLNKQIVERYTLTKKEIILEKEENK